MASILYSMFKGTNNENKHIYCKPYSEATEGSSAVYRSKNQFEQLKLVPDDECTTMQDIFLRACRLYSHKSFLGTIDASHKHYNWKNFKEIKQLAEYLGSNVNQKKLFTHVNDFENINMDLIGVFSKNREEWLVLEYSNFLYRKTMVPLYDTLGPESITYILDQTGIETVFSAVEGVDALLKSKDICKLKNIVLFDEIPEEKREKLTQRGLTLYNYKDLIAPTQVDEYAKCLPEDVITFSYTSGTTGFPKGAMITNKNLVSVVAIAKEEDFQTGDIYLSYLPLPHILERIAVSCMLYLGIQIGFYRGDTRQLKDDLELLKPTIFASVPRVYNRFYDMIKAKFNQTKGIQGWLLAKGLAAKLQNSKNGQYTHMLYDKLIFNKVKQALGGNVRIAVVGGAPISGEVLTFMRACLSVPILEGYGQTESTGAAFSTHAADGTTGHIGGCRGHMEYKLVDIPEMGYTSKDTDKDGKPTPRGEICVRGYGVFAGYYKQKDKTEEIIDADGWLHSGDVGRIDHERGCLTIIDRKKNIFKLAQGEYIAPDKIENIYLRAAGVEEVFVYGDSLQSTLVSIVVPSKDFLKKYAESKGLEFNVQQLCENKELIKTILDGMVKLGKAEGLFSFEQVKSLHLFPESFQTIDCMTNTLKIKRKECRDYFRDTIDKLYAEQGPAQ
ncbi:hypothetical protein ABPG74_005481 [Tetrahymena malaccensis]